MFQRVLLDFVLKTFGLGAENEARTHASRVWFLANYIYTPDPWKGRLGSLRARHISSNEKAALLDCFSSFERKTRLELATPTLARLCSTN